ncbi:MAG: amidohydrolase family protein [Hyphomicrobiaceae bacterium]|nr:amidohydrolase family protein [Hyphomicrobiaceae bacterium]
MSTSPAAPWNSYGPTAARTHGRPGREVRPRSLTLDAHAHIVVPGAAAIAKPHLPASSDHLTAYSSPETKAVAALQSKDRAVNLVDQALRLREMDAMGIDMQRESPAPNQCYFNLAADIGARAIAAVNDGIAEWVAKEPRRFAGLGTVPLQDGGAAVEELERCMSRLGLRGVEILTNVAGREISDPSLEPFWAKAAELGALVMIHPSGFTEARRLSRYYFNNVIGNPFDTTLALHYLIFDGVLERNPGLKVLASHGGGYLGGYSGRIDHAWGARSDSRGELPRPPTSYFKQIWVDTIVFTSHQLRHLVEVFGADHVLIGTDYPFDMAEMDPIGHVVQAGLDAEVVAAVCGGNAQRLLGV